MICERSMCGQRNGYPLSDYKITGLTGEMFIVLLMGMLARQNDELDIKVRLAGGDPDKNSDEPKTADEAADYLKDPLARFPFDVDFKVLPKPVIAPRVAADEQKIAIAASMGTPLSQSQIDRMWTSARSEALFGPDPLARRAAINVELWSLFCYMRRNGHEPTRQELKGIVRQSFTAALLFPNDSDLLGYRRRCSQQGVRAVPTPSGQIPPWHLENLRLKGKLGVLLNEFQAACGLPRIEV